MNELEQLFFSGLSGDIVGSGIQHNNTMMSKIYSTLLALCMLASLSKAQQFDFDPAKWDVDATQFVLENFEGKQGLYLRQGRVTLKNYEFFTGTIEYDIYITPRRGFPSIQFRIQDDGINYEEFYIRPHQSGNPDANQYTPVFNGLASWQLYYGQGHAAAIAYKMHAWNHVKLVVRERTAEVFINDMEKPLLYIPELKHKPVPGKIGFGGGGPSAFHVANLKVTKEANPSLMSPEKPFPALEEGTISQWSVSGTFDEKLLEKKYELNREIKRQDEWTKIDVEWKGYANLASVAIRQPESNTVFAKVIIESDREQIKQMAYGFSDRVRIYLNDKILAGGQNGFRSRDYRYLGTVGYFDDVYLPLKKGRNELWVAVSESFGGWTIMAKFDDMSGIQVTTE